VKIIYNRRKYVLMIESIEVFLQVVIMMIMREQSMVRYHQQLRTLISETILINYPLIIKHIPRLQSAWLHGINYFSVIPINLTSRLIVFIIVLISSEIAKRIVPRTGETFIMNFRRQWRNLLEYAGSMCLSSFVGTLYTIVVHVLVPFSDTHPVALVHFPRALIVNFVPKMITDTFF